MIKEFFWKNEYFKEYFKEYLLRDPNIPVRGTFELKVIETYWSSAKTRTKSCTWGKNAQCVSKGWGWTGWAAALQKDPGVLVYKRMNRTHQHSVVATKTSCTLGYIRKSQQVEGITFSPFYVAFGVPHLLSRAQCCPPPSWERERDQWTGKSPTPKVAEGRARLF